MEEREEMKEHKPTSMCICAEIQRNNKDEAQAIEGYTKLLQAIADSDLSAEHKEMADKYIKEIISDELNHQLKLDELYCTITGIEINEN